ncbi:hypothetical protein [Marinoscillum sp. MHG1-6]|uniref:hypothetical protein n=1 Tax=Marinoscillum sp. MHG1-6 TaxID=2959627 RepID=UPI002157A189|nr:hypothetical protein [Marinoscillum sp. MHG1-6]
MRFLITLLVSIVAFTGCKDKIICPAFQSTYILDDSVRMVYYSYLWKLDEAERTEYLASKASIPVSESSATDTAAIADLPTNPTPTPKQTDYFAYAGDYKVDEREVKKSKYGIVKYEPYWLKNYRMKTAPMENVLRPEEPALPPGLEEDTAAVEVGEFYVSDFEDSLGVDSTAIAFAGADSIQDDFALPTLARAPPPEKKPEPKFLYGYDPKDKLMNVEQEYYNKHFGQYLIQQPMPKKKPKPKPEPTDSADFDSGFSDSFVPDGEQTDSFVEPTPTEEGDQSIDSPVEDQNDTNQQEEAVEPEEVPEPVDETNDQNEPQGDDLGF